MKPNLAILRAATIISALFVVLTTSTESAAVDTDDRIVGKWEATLELDLEHLKKLIGETRDFDDQVAALKEDLGTIQIRLELNGDGTSLMVTSGLPGDVDEVSRAGTWDVQSTEVVEIDEKEHDVVVVLGKSKDDEGKETEETIRFVLLGADTIEMRAKEIEESFFAFPRFTRQQD